MRRRQHRDRGLVIPAPVVDSPLRQVDPRVKLLLSTLVSLTVMLPLGRLGLFMVLYVLLLLWAHLLPTAVRQVWRLRWLLVVIFVVDWLFISVDLAVIVVLRLVLLVGVFAFFVSTTTPNELRLALERLRVPYRYAFSLSLAFQSVGLLQQKWRAIQEAQVARGLRLSIGRRGGSGNGEGARFWDGWPKLRNFVALTVPAIVLTTHRAWGMTEAAYARGFDTPHRSVYRTLSMRWTDWALVLAALCIVGGLLCI
jgi:energy-coupling factor transport system permease protein